MNRILVEQDKLKNYQDSNIIIKNNTITFLSSGDYTIEYINCNNIELNINLEENIMIKLFEYADNQNIKVENTYNLNSYSTLILFKFYNNKEVLEKLIFNLNKSYSKLDYHFSNIC